ncbi:MAG: hypothetical protein M3436_11335 [Pseudomonadota bacterium]|nr:hypothetical protein [Pseudomonadota bacterium]
MQRVKRFLLILAVLDTGCAQGPEVPAMVPDINTASYVSGPKTIAILRARGGEETSFFMTSMIDNEGFRKALTVALEKSGLFRIVFIDLHGDYVLYPKIVFQNVVPGPSMRSVLKVEYRIVDGLSEKELWQRRVISTYDASLAEALYGVSRVRKAHEGSVRENIHSLLKQLSEFVAADITRDTSNPSRQPAGDPR